jgi:hypothetical protein
MRFDTRNALVMLAGPVLAKELHLRLQDPAASAAKSLGNAVEPSISKPEFQAQGLSEVRWRCLLRWAGRRVVLPAMRQSAALVRRCSGRGPPLEDTHGHPCLGQAHEPSWREP